MNKNKTVTPDFKTFWDLYGLKRERIGAENAWMRLSVKDRRAAIAGIAAYREECLRSGVAMKYAQGYLNHRRWEDEPAPVPAGCPKETAAKKPLLLFPQDDAALPSEADIW